MTTFERRQVLLVGCGLAPVLPQILEAWETILKLTFPARGTNLSTSERKQVLLMRCGLAPVLAQILEAWEPAAGEATLRLAIETVDNLALQEVSLDRLF